MTWQRGLAFFAWQQSWPALWSMVQWAMAVDVTPALWQTPQGVKATKTPRVKATRWMKVSVFRMG
jgi:hypothetical protein